MGINTRNFDSVASRGQENLPSIANQPQRPVDQSIKVLAGKCLLDSSLQSLAAIQGEHVPAALAETHDIVQLSSNTSSPQIRLSILAEQIGIDVASLKQKYVQNGKLNIEKLVDDHQGKIENMAKFQTTYQKIANKFEMKGGELVTTDPISSLQFVNEHGKLVDIDEEHIHTGINESTLKKALSVALIHLMNGETHATYTLADGKSIHFHVPNEPGKTALKVTMCFDQVVKIGDQEMHSVLGAGAFGEVRLVLNMSKAELQVQKTAKDQATDQLQNEYKLLSELNPHNDVVGIQKRPHQLTNLSNGSVSYLAPRYDCDLNQLTQDSGFRHIPLDKKLSGTKQLLSGLAYLHNQGVQHGDLKVHNTFIGYDEIASDIVVHTGDLGSARRFDENFAENPRPPSGSTFMMTAADIKNMLTVDHRTPAGQKLEFARDVFAMGAIIYELITGTPPYEATTIDIGSVRTADDWVFIGSPQLAPSPERWIDDAAEKLQAFDVPDEIIDVLLQMMDADPLNRPTAQYAFDKLNL